jgi:hypothetical protein
MGMTAWPPLLLRGMYPNAVEQQVKVNVTGLVHTYGF